MALTLGNFVFENFEIPERINFGGAQRVATHRMVGGRRVVDAMGPDDADITWGGRFRGFDATYRARQIDTLRRTGKKVELAWHAFGYDVVVTQFKAEFDRPYEIPYSITVHVVRDLSAAEGNGGVKGFDSLLRGDLGGVASALGSYAAPLARAALSVGVAAISGGPGAMRIAGLGAIQSLTGRVVSDLSSATIGALGLTGSAGAFASTLTTGAFASLSSLVSGNGLSTIGAAGLSAAGAMFLGQAGAMSLRMTELDGMVSGKSIGGISAADDPSTLADSVSGQAATLEEAYSSERVRATLRRLQANVVAGP
jgi:hypothetical protein